VTTPKRKKKPTELGDLIIIDWIKALHNNGVAAGGPLKESQIKTLAHNLNGCLKLAGWESPQELGAMTRGWVTPRGGDRWTAHAQISVPLKKCTAKKADRLAEQLAKFITRVYEKILKEQAKQRNAKNPKRKGDS